MSNRYLPFREVSQLTGGKSRSTIWRWVNSGLFPKPYQIGPNSVGWKESELSEWLESQQQTAA